MYKILPDELDYSYELQVLLFYLFLNDYKYKIFLGLAVKVYAFITKDIYYYVHLLLPKDFFYN